MYIAKFFCKLYNPPRLALLFAGCIRLEILFYEINLVNDDDDDDENSDQNSRLSWALNNREPELRSIYNTTSSNS